MTDPQPSPSTLRPNRTEDTLTDDPNVGRSYKPPIVAASQGKSVSSGAMSDWLTYRRENGADDSGGRVAKLTWVPAQKSGITGLKGISDTGTASDSSGDSAGEWKWLPDPVGQALYEKATQLENDYKQFLKDSGAGSGKSFADAEGDKQDEVTRQFKDFLARAKGTYDLMKSEQEYGMNADDQNIQNAEAWRRGLLPGAGFYTSPTMEDSLSRIIRPSLPNYLSPDYRTNQAVGLPGSEGFNDPQYDEYGMPKYATGTSPLNEPWLANVPPDVLAMVGKKMWVPIPEPREPIRWPWGGGNAQ